MKPIVRERHIVSSEFEGVRFQEYAAEVLELITTRSGVKKAIKRGELLIDGKPTGTGRFMTTGMLVELIEGELPASRRFIVDLPVIFEDEQLAIISKPAGIPVSGNTFKTVQNGLAGVICHSNEKDALPIPRPVHRLDSLTSGLLIIAKTTAAMVKLGHLFEERKIQKTYQAIVMGRTEESGEINFPVQDKVSLSSYKRIKEIPSLKSGTLTLLELSPHTGRTHQLRIHCAKSGFPIAGDTVYGDPKKTILHKGLFLAATQLCLPHPISGEEVRVEIELPKKFSRYLDGEERRFKKYSE